MELPSANRHKPLLAVILLGVLLVATAAAWWVSKIQGGTLRAGIAIMQEIRQRKLPAFWGDASHEQWYLIGANGETVGWMCRRYEPAAGGGYQGSDTVFRGRIDEGFSLDVTRWRLSDDLSGGAYLAQSWNRTFVRMGRVATTPTSETSIVVRGDTVTTQQRIGGEPFSAESRTAENYLLEGTLPLAIARVAQLKTEALFTLILDAVPPQGSDRLQVPFFAYRLRYVGPSPRNGQWSEVESTTSGGRVSIRETHTVDADGRIVLSAQTGTDAGTRKSFTLTTTLTTREKLLETFPEAPGLLQALPAGSTAESLPETMPQTPLEDSTEDNSDF